MTWAELLRQLKRHLTLENADRSAMVVTGNGGRLYIVGVSNAGDSTVLLDVTTEKPKGAP